MQIEPLFNRILAKRKEFISNVGLIIPKDAQSVKYHEGEVLSVGEDCHDSIKAGDKIIWGRFADGKMEYENDDGEKVEVVVLNDDDVLAKIIEEAK